MFHTEPSDLIAVPVFLAVGCAITNALAFSGADRREQAFALPLPPPVVFLYR
jgi:hypothetical protein